MVTKASWEVEATDMEADATSEDVTKEVATDVNLD